MSTPQLISLSADPEQAKQQLSEFAGQPTLFVSVTGSYQLIYDDSGTGAKSDVQIYSPTPSDSTFFILGHMAQNYHGAPNNHSVIVKASNDDGNPILKAPTGWTQVWNDHGSGGKNDGSIWIAQAPDGYIAIGAVAVAGYDAPNLSNYRCVRYDYAVSAAAGDQIWTDQGSGAKMDVSLFKIQGIDGLFQCQGSYVPPRSGFYALKPTS